MNIYLTLQKPSAIAIITWLLLSTAFGTGNYWVFPRPISKTPSTPGVKLSQHANLNAPMMYCDLLFNFVAPDLLPDEEDLILNAISHFIDAGHPLTQYDVLDLVQVVVTKLSPSRLAHVPFRDEGQEISGYQGFKTKRGPCDVAPRANRE